MRSFGMGCLYPLLPALTLFVALIFPIACISQDCEALRSASATDAVNALDHGEIKTAFCSRAAFQLIENLPEQEAIPIFINHLRYKRPLSELESRGVFFRGRGAEEMYPAIRSLFRFGNAAEPALIDFIAHDQNEGGIERSNALDTLLLIRHGGVVKLIETLHKRSLAFRDIPDGLRLESAAKDLIKRWCYSDIESQCQAAVQ